MRDDERELNKLLEHLDHPVPPVDVRMIVARANARPHRYFGMTAKAAGIVLAIGVAGVAYAIPGSPVRAWTARVVQAVFGRGPETTTPEQTGTVEPPTAGIAVAPGNMLVIRFAARQDSGSVRVMLTDDAELAITARRGAATFTTGAQDLTVDNRGSVATFEIRVPRAAPSIDIEVAGTRIFAKRGASIDTRIAADSGGAYVLSLRPGS